MPRRSIVARHALAAALVAAAAVAIAATPAFGAGGTGLNPLLPDAKSPNGRDLYDLYLYYVSPFAILVFVGVEAALLIVVLRFRRTRQGPGYRAPQWHGNRRLEVVWTLIPFLILCWIGFHSFRVLQQDFVKPADSRTDMEIAVTGFQFGWFYQYPEGFRVTSVGFQTAPMVVPVGKLVRLRMQSNDVIHSFWVPELMGKTDTVPGYDNYTWIKATETGTWRGECAELCGAGHYTMQILVKAVTPEEYAAWASSEAAKAKASPSPSPSASGSPSPSASPSASASPSGSASPAGSASPGGSPSTAAQASPGASPSPSGSPRPSP